MTTSPVPTTSSSDLVVASYHQRARPFSLSLPDLPPDVQEIILAQTHLSPLTARYPPSPGYSRSFLRRIMAVAESQGHDIADDLTLAYVELVSSQPAGNVCAVYEGMDSEVAYVSYPLAQGWLTLREELAKISKGTTGLVTWEAALRFGEFLLDGRLDVSGKRVLELGAGTGFLGLLAARQGAESVMLTDVDQGVLARLRENVAINDSGQPHGFGSSVTVCRLDWNHLDLPLLAACDLVMCADVVYDPSLISPLVATLAAFLNGEKLKEAWVALTVRREGTLDMFLEALRLAGIVFDRIHIGKVGAVPELFCHEEGCGDVVLIKMSMRTCHQIL